MTNTLKQASDGKQYWFSFWVPDGWKPDGTNGLVRTLSMFAYEPKRNDIEGLAERMRNIDTAFGITDSSWIDDGVFRVTTRFVEDPDTADFFDMRMSALQTYDDRIDYPARDY